VWQLLLNPREPFPLAALNSLRKPMIISLLAEALGALHWLQGELLDYTAASCILTVRKYRLSEDPNVSVGVVEAGEYLVNDALIDTPGMLLLLQLYQSSTYGNL
jgi:hypothetical protein